MLPKHKYLLTYRYAEIIHDLTVIFVKKCIDYKSRTRDQMEQAARSAKQNIVEGVSQQASLKGQIKLLAVAQASTEELLADYEDFLRQRNLTIWPKTDKRVSQYRQWGIQATKDYPPKADKLLKLLKEPKGLKEKEVGNLMLTLCHQLSYLLTKQIRATEKRFIEKGGYSENLFLKRLKSLKLSKSPKTAFTLMELLIVVSLIAVISTAALSLFNPLKQIKKSWETKRKNELAVLRKILEDYYNDKNHYPPANEVCYDSPSSPRIDNYGLTACFCHICGDDPNSPSFSPYLSRLPCDPQSKSNKNYLYDFDCRDANNPQWFRIYTKFSDLETANSDLDSTNLNCLYLSCGPGPDYGFSYGVNSPNVDLERAVKWMYCSKTGCNICGQSGSLSSCPSNPLDYCQNDLNLRFPENVCAQSCPCP